MKAALFYQVCSNYCKRGELFPYKPWPFYNDKISAVSTYMGIPCFPYNSKHILLDNASISFIIAWRGAVECFFLYAIQLA